MFRSRFNEAFSKSLPHYGPQDIENGVAGPIPGEQVERLLCALLGLVLNRKKDIECALPYPLLLAFCSIFCSYARGSLLISLLTIDRNGHYTRALEEAIQTHAGQWPTAWQAKNPLHGGGSFNKMTPEERVCCLDSQHRPIH